MKPIDRFNLDIRRVHYLQDDQYGNEVFLLEADRKVDKTNVFSIHAKRYECPADLRSQTIQVRYDKRPESSPHTRSSGPESSSRTAP